MATKNLAHATHIDGSRINPEEIKKGLLVYFPSGLGGVLKCECTHVDSEFALFESQYKEWPNTFKVEFGVEDLPPEEFESLLEAMRAYDSCGRLPTDEQRALVNKANSLGYVYCRSYTQANWAEMGRLRYRNK